MKHRLLAFGIVLASVLGFAHKALADEPSGPIVQGIDYYSTLKQGSPMKAPMMREGTILEPGTELVYDGDFTFDMIENWSGEGSKSAALVLQWNTGKDEAALVFGYHWDGEATGFDMLKTVVENNPQLFALCQPTNVGCEISPIAPGGYTVCGIGWDVESTGDIGISDNNNSYFSDNGFYNHPRGWNVETQTGNPVYDYDDWTADDPSAIWQAGWYTGYWSYWYKDSDSDQFSYSGWGIACRGLVDGCWDGWNYMPNLNSCPWKPFVSAPSLTPADAKTQFTSGGICFKLKDYAKKTVVVAQPFGGITYSGAINIPEKFTDEQIEYTVVGIDNSAFAGAEITNVTLPATVTKLGDNAFAGSTVSAINITDVVTSIGSACFAGCPNIKQAYFPSKLTAVPEYAYMGTGITDVLIPDYITDIKAGAFSYCESLKTVTMGTSVRNIGEEAFAGCTALESVTVNSANPPAAEANAFDIGTTATLIVPEGFADAYAAATGWSVFTKHSTTLIDVKVGDRFVLDHMPFVVTSLGNAGNAVHLTHHYILGVDKPSATQVREANRSGYAGVTAVNVPATIKYQGKDFKVEAVCDSAFYDANAIKSVTIPTGIQLMGGTYLFYNCSLLESVTLPSDATTIGNYAFGNCKALKSIEFPATITTLGERLFYYCSALESVTLPSAITKLPNYIFYYCSALKEAIVPEGVTTLGSNAFGYCRALTSVSLPSSLTTINSNAFYYCSALTSIELPKGVTKLSDYMFAGCSSLVFEIPSQITAIGQYCFKDCSSLTELVIPRGVTTMGYYGVFEGDTNLKIYSAIETPKAAASAYTFRLAFRPSTVYATITVLTGTKSLYSNLTGWKNATINEPQLSAATFGEPTFKSSFGHVEMTVPFSTIYGEEYPKAFTDANAQWLASAIEATATSDSRTVINGTAKWADGNVIITFEDVPSDTELTYTATGKRGDVTYTMSAVKYSNPSPEMNVSVDFNKIDFWVGEGDNKAALVLRWNDCVEGNASYTCPLDNMVMGVRFSGSAKVADIVAAAVAGNRRLGNPSEGCYTYDMTGRGNALTAYDHNKATTAEMAWRTWLGHEGKVKGFDAQQEVASGDIVCLDYQAAGAELPTEYAEPFYLPADDKLGIFFPENTHFTLRDNCHLFVPFYINAGQGGTFTRVSVANDAEKQYAPYVSSAPISSYATQGNTTLRSHMNFVTGLTGSFPMTVSATLNGEVYTDSTRVVIDAPVVPVSSITLTPTDTIVITGYPNRNVAKLDYTFAPENATYTKLNWTSTDAQVVSVSNGQISAGGKQGEAAIRLVSAADPEVYAEVPVRQVLNQLVEEIQFGPEDGIFNMLYMDVVLIDPVLLPETADNRNFTYEIIGDPEVATTYTTKDIINHKPGTVQVKISALDGSDVAKTITINFAEPDRTPLADNYQDGTFWLNEEWYTHTNGSINYITKDGEPVYRVYESQNPYESFGATSCSAVIYGGYVFVSSKQPQDGGDPRIGGGRLVIFDAKTLKKVAAFKDIDAAGGDGRTVVGVKPGKVYVGTTGGIKPLYFNNEFGEFTLADSYIEGTGGGSLYAGQVGDMICVDGKVYAVKQSTGIYVIDAENDKLVATIPESAAVALVQSYDGSIWCASTQNLYRIDPKTNQFAETHAFPASFPQSWSAWRPSNLFASKKENVLYWGHSNGWNAGCDWIYRWEIDTDFPTQPIFNSKFPGYPGSRGSNNAYAGGGYDSRTNTLLVASCSGAGSSARYNHINFIDGTTGELKRSLELKPYFWFPSHPLFPDKYAPMLTVEELNLHLENGPFELNLDDYISDPDNLKCNIKLSIGDIYSDIAYVALNGRDLIIMPYADGEFKLPVTLESNGVITDTSILVTIDTTTGTPAIKAADGSLQYTDGNLEITGYEGYIFCVCDLSGRAVKRFAVENDVTTVPLPLPAGVYIAKGESVTGCTTLKFIVK